MRVTRVASLAAVAAITVGCGSAPTGRGQAQLWITRDRGARVLLVRSVPAGLTALQALEREADVKTRYGGRFVQAINGIAGNASRRRDWFYFVNGIESDRGAVEYRLHAGDVEWWDYRSWRGRMAQPVVVGAFPEPFLHGFGGRTRPAVVRFASPRLARGARAIARLLRARSVAPATRPVPRGANAFLLVGGPARFTASLRGGGPTAPVTFTFAGDAVGLARHPQSVRFLYALEL